MSAVVVLRVLAAARRQREGAARRQAEIPSLPATTHAHTTNDRAKILVKLLKTLVAAQTGHVNSVVLLAAYSKVMHSGGAQAARYDVTVVYT